VNLALFDFDGTITTREMFPDFMHFAVTPGRLAVGRVVLMPLVVGYKLGVITGNTIRSSVVRFGFRGVPVAQVEQAGERFAREVLPGVVRPMALERIQWHKAQGDVVVVVSAALDLYLAPWCGQHQLDLICSKLEVEDGVLTGRYCGKQCASQEKSRRVLETYDVRDFSVVYAYGDTGEDMDMLSLASRKYFRWEEVT
jgi:HAD-superfamily subfamily IB hydrolase, TIGR01490